MFKKNTHIAAIQGAVHGPEIYTASKCFLKGPYNIYQ